MRGIIILILIFVSTAYINLYTHSEYNNGAKSGTNGKTNIFDISKELDATIALSPKYKLQISQTDSNILDIKTNGWAWRSSVPIKDESRNVAPSYVYGIAIDRNPYNQSQYAIAVYERFLKNVSGTQYTVNLIHVFIADFSNPTINETHVIPETKHIYMYNHTNNQEYNDRITKIDLGWWNNTSIVIAFARQERETYPDTDRYHIYKIMLTYNNTTQMWQEESINELEQANGTVEGLDITYNDNYFIVSIVCKNLKWWFNVVPYWQLYATFHELKKGNRATGTEDLLLLRDLYVSNSLLTEDNYTVLFVSLRKTEYDSEIKQIYYNINSNTVTISTSALLTTSDMSNAYGIYLDFKDLSASLVNHSWKSNNPGSFIVVFKGFTEYEGYYAYLTVNYSWGAGFGVEDYGYNSSIMYCSSFKIIDNNYTDNVTYLFWLDTSRGVAEIKNARMLYQNGSVVLGESNYSVITDSRTIDFDVDIYHSEDFVLAHASCNDSYTRSYINVGYYDTDRDGLGDWEEINIYNVTYPVTSYTDRDSDGDNLGDGAEILIYGTHPNSTDTDGDFLNDTEEIVGVDVVGIGIRYTDPLNPDSDGDGIKDGNETKGIRIVIAEDSIDTLVYSDPLKDDTDGDGLDDHTEVINGWVVSIEFYNGSTISYNVYSDPNNDDTDNDLLRDSDEYLCGADPWIADTDSDNLTDWDEYWEDTNITDGDSDDDYLGDYDEVRGFNITNPIAGKTYTVYTDPWDPDCDRDGLFDGNECHGINIVGIGIVQTDPNKADCDADGLTDYNETMGFVINKTTYYTHPWNPDTDGDFLLDGEEVFWGTNPRNNDTDSDQLFDGNETNGINITYIGIRITDPLDPDSDGDGLGDYDEAKVYYTDPTKKDTDGDGLEDPVEVEGWNVTVIFMNGTCKEYFVVPNPTSPDSDHDGLSDYLEYYYGVDPLTNDTDNDGLSDWIEYSIKTNMTNADSDFDGVSDYDEVNGLYVEGIGLVKTNPNSNDTDKDGLSDYNEIFGVYIAGIGRVYTNPGLVDTDGDRLSDYEEAIMRHTNPSSADTDGDGLSDYEEIYNFGTSPTVVDTDGDGLSDYEEIFNYLTDPIDEDSDDDGISDYDEAKTYDTDPLDPDPDGDDLGDFEEIEIGTDPLDPDSDDDGLSDYEEAKIFNTDPNSQDTDGDGLDDYDELVVYGTNATNVDTDNDELIDGEEIVFGTDPKNNDTVSYTHLTLPTTERV